MVVLTVFACESPWLNPWATPPDDPACKLCQASRSDAEGAWALLDLNANKLWSSGHGFFFESMPACHAASIEILNLICPPNGGLICSPHARARGGGSTTKGIIPMNENENDHEEAINEDTDTMRIIRQSFDELDIRISECIKQKCAHGGITSYDSLLACTSFITACTSFITEFPWIRRRGFRFYWKGFTGRVQTPD